MLICCLFKLKDSFNRFKLSKNINESNLELEYLETLEELQEKIIYKDYDLSIIDKNIWWNEEAKELFSIKNIKIIEFEGDFRILENLVLDNVIDKDDEKELDVKYEDTHKIKYLVKEKRVEVPKIIYKTRNIKQEIISIISGTEIIIKNILGINLGLTFSQNNKTLIVDMTKYNNLIYLCNYKKSSKQDVDSNINANNINQYCYLINENLSLIELKNSNKECIKKILFAARDFEKVIFIIDDLNNKLIISASHNVYIITDPSLLSLNINQCIIKKIKEQGQIDNNIFFIITSYEVDKENIKYMYKGYQLYFIDRSNHIILSNKRKFIKENFYKKFNTKESDKPLKKLFSKIF